MRRTGHGRQGLAMASVGTGGGTRRQSAAPAAQGSEPNAAPDGESSAPARSAQDAPRHSHPLATSAQPNRRITSRAEWRTLRARLLHAEGAAVVPFEVGSALSYS